MKILLSVTPPPSSVALHEDTTTPSGSGAQASDQKSKRLVSVIKALVLVN